MKTKKNTVKDSSPSRRSKRTRKQRTIYSPSLNSNPSRKSLTPVRKDSYPAKEAQARKLSTKPKKKKNRAQKLKSCSSVLFNEIYDATDSSQISSIISSFLIRVKSNPKNGLAEILSFIVEASGAKRNLIPERVKTTELSAFLKKHVITPIVLSARTRQELLRFPLKLYISKKTKNHFIENMFQFFQLLGETFETLKDCGKFLQKFLKSLKILCECNLVKIRMTAVAALLAMMKGTASFCVELWNDVATFDEKYQQCVDISGLRDDQEFTHIEREYAQARLNYGNVMAMDKSSFKLVRRKYLEAQDALLSEIESQDKVKESIRGEVVDRFTDVTFTLKKLRFSHEVLFNLFEFGFKERRFDEHVPLRMYIQKALRDVFEVYFSFALNETTLRCLSICLKDEDIEVRIEALNTVKVLSKHVAALKNEIGYEERNHRVAEAISDDEDVSVSTFEDLKLGLASEGLQNSFKAIRRVMLNKGISETESFLSTISSTIIRLCSIGAEGNTKSLEKLDDKSYDVLRNIIDVVGSHSMDKVQLFDTQHAIFKSPSKEKGAFVLGFYRAFRCGTSNSSQQSFLKFSCVFLKAHFPASLNGEPDALKQRSLQILRKCHKEILEAEEGSIGDLNWLHHFEEKKKSKRVPYSTNIWLLHSIYSQIQVFLKSLGGIISVPQFSVFVAQLMGQTEREEKIILSLILKAIASTNDAKKMELYEDGVFELLESLGSDYVICCNILETLNSAMKQGSFFSKNKKRAELFSVVLRLLSMSSNQNFLRVASETLTLIESEKLPKEYIKQAFTIWEKLCVDLDRLFQEFMETAREMVGTGLCECARKLSFALGRLTAMFSATYTGISKQLSITPGKMTMRIKAFIALVFSPTFGTQLSQYKEESVRSGDEESLDELVTALASCTQYCLKFSLTQITFFKEELYEILTLNTVSNTDVQEKLDALYKLRETCEVLIHDVLSAAANNQDEKNELVEEAKHFAYLAFSSLVSLFSDFELRKLLSAVVDSSSIEDFTLKLFDDYKFFTRLSSCEKNLERLLITNVFKDIQDYIDKKEKMKSEDLAEAHRGLIWGSRFYKISLQPLLNCASHLDFGNRTMQTLLLMLFQYLSSQDENLLKFLYSFIHCLLLRQKSQIGEVFAKVLKMAFDKAREIDADPTSETEDEDSQSELVLRITRKLLSILTQFTDKKSIQDLCLNLVETSYGLCFEDFPNQLGFSSILLEELDVLFKWNKGVLAEKLQEAWKRLVNSLSNADKHYLFEVEEEYDEQEPVEENRKLFLNIENALCVSTVYNKRTVPLSSNNARNSRKRKNAPEQSPNSSGSIRSNKSSPRPKTRHSMDTVTPTKRKLNFLNSPSEDAHLSKPAISEVPTESTKEDHERELFSLNSGIAGSTENIQTKKAVPQFDTLDDEGSTSIKDSDGFSELESPRLTIGTPFGEEKEDPANFIGFTGRKIRASRHRGRM
eukprot:snap_masked-scaffold_13-processed-gene-0.25-mRNA-1 protein AED:1.00 eAED:1.00 QI:0/0/0/0/1/1/2/0/1458